MLIWKKRNITELFLCYIIVYFIMVHNGLCSFYGMVDCIGFDFARFSSLSSEHLCIFILRGAIFKIICYILYFAF